MMLPIMLNVLKKTCREDCTAETRRRLSERVIDHSGGGRNLTY